MSSVDVTGHLIQSLTSYNSWLLGEKKLMKNVEEERNMQTASHVKKLNFFFSL